MFTARHRQQRLQWSTQHLRLNRRQSGQVLFSDESKVNVNRLDGRVRVWRARGESRSDHCIQRYNQWGGGSLQICGDISQFRRTNLVFLNGNVNAATYANGVLRPEAVPFLWQNIGRNGTLQHDNARPHTAQHTTTFLRNNGVQVMDWSAISPDLSPIENVWAELKRRVYAHRPPPANVRASERPYARVEQHHSTVNRTRQQFNETKMPSLYHRRRCLHEVLVL